MARRPAFGWGSNVHFNDAILRLCRERGLHWTSLSFDAQAALVEEYRKTLPTPKPSLPPIRAWHGGQSAPVAGGTGKLWGGK
jgi:hypothetical protein